jgi:histidinol dehydrogenase
LRPDELTSRTRRPVDDATLAAAARIVEDVRERGEVGLREHAERLGDLEPGAPLVIERRVLDAHLAALPADERALLERRSASDVSPRHSVPACCR